ncbi:hypothetical protein D8674_039465 [Pyrus ussuriensis x Pyrus communis]|uniref:Uncharacterized protein n=1 Tax=Pyrus ussuriensis x Pyrus communis TaxID=2448454 RepID=A0A5N5GZ34_9ROSA|nr:hypothetical protein D8674_039465 [Pyrus ussuriensis x Pyrus communis]
MIVTFAHYDGFILDVVSRPHSTASDVASALSFWYKAFDLPWCPLDPWSLTTEPYPVQGGRKPTLGSLSFGLPALLLSNQPRTSRISRKLPTETGLHHH